MVSGAAPGLAGCPARFPIWLWYLTPSDLSSRLDCQGFCARNPGAKVYNGAGPGRPKWKSRLQPAARTGDDVNRYMQSVRVMIPLLVCLLLVQAVGAAGRKSQVRTVDSKQELIIQCTRPSRAKPAANAISIWTRSSVVTAAGRRWPQPRSPCGLGSKYANAFGHAGQDQRSVVGYMW